MHTLSITSTKTMTYEADRSVETFAVIEILFAFAGVVFQAARRIGTVSTVPAFRAADA
jgi:hypothetical protein